MSYLVSCSSHLISAFSVVSVSVCSFCVLLHSHCSITVCSSQTAHIQCSDHCELSAVLCSLILIESAVSLFLSFFISSLTLYAVTSIHSLNMMSFTAVNVNEAHYWVMKSTEYEMNLFAVLKLHTDDHNLTVRSIHEYEKKVIYYYVFECEAADSVTVSLIILIFQQINNTCKILCDEVRLQTACRIWRVTERSRIVWNLFAVIRSAEAHWLREFWADEFNCSQVSAALLHPCSSAVVSCQHFYVVCSLIILLYTDCWEECIWDWVASQCLSRLWDCHQLICVWWWEQYFRYQHLRQIHSLIHLFSQPLQLCVQIK